MQRLYNGEALSAKELADEFGVNIRTIQRDLNERVSMILPIEKNDKHYYLDSMGGGNSDFDKYRAFC